MYSIAVVMETNLQQAQELLEKNGYRVLAPYTAQQAYHTVGEFGEVKTLYTGKVIDCEANGLASQSKPFEIGCVVFTYDAHGNIYTVSDHFSMFEDIGEPIEDDVRKITGRTNDDIAGHVFDDAKINDVFATGGIVIAHNASYDRPRLEKRFRIFEKCPWSCSYHDIDWLSYGVIDTKLRELCMDLCGLHFHGHHAENDAYALLDVLNAPLPTTDGTVFQTLLVNARKEVTRLWAIDTPYDKKDTLKSYGFRWDDTSSVKGYALDSQDKAVDIEWLERTVYGYELTEDMIPTATINAFNKHSTRITPQNEYLRHKLTFGKYKSNGMLLRDIAKTDRDYIRWCLTPGNLNFQLDPDMIRTLQYYFGK